METKNTNYEKIESQDKAAAKALMNQIEESAIREELMTPEEIKQETLRKKATLKLEANVAKIGKGVKWNVDKALENKYNIIERKFGHDVYNWGNVTVWSKIIDLWEVRLKSKKTEAEKMNQANAMLEQVGLKAA